MISFFEFHETKIQQYTEGDDRRADDHCVDDTGGDDGEADDRGADDHCVDDTEGDETKG